MPLYRHRNSALSLHLAPMPRRTFLASSRPSESARPENLTIGHTPYTLYYEALGVITSEADYAKTLGQVYHDLLVDLLRFCPSLIVLLVDIGPTLSGAPSWVPDWSSATERTWFSSKKYIYGLISEPKTSTPPMIRLSECRTELTLRGVLKGSATDIFGPFQSTAIGKESGIINDRTNLANLASGLNSISQWLSLARRDTSCRNDTTPSRRQSLQCYVEVPT